MARDINDLLGAQAAAAAPPPLLCTKFTSLGASSALALGRRRIRCSGRERGWNGDEETLSRWSKSHQEQKAKKEKREQETVGMILGDLSAPPSIQSDHSITKGVLLKCWTKTTRR